MSDTQRLQKQAATDEVLKRAWEMSSDAQKAAHEARDIAANARTIADANRITIGAVQDGFARIETLLAKLIDSQQATHALLEHLIAERRDAPRAR